ncbi:MAG: hypothetical protein MUF54_08240 [Polyangiaceae bacterium]|jgi:hypothetical protein|nr:hypothetical protein [Polyangiaceae bacterium]
MTDFPACPECDFPGLYWRSLEWEANHPHASTIYSVEVECPFCGWGVRVNNQHGEVYAVDDIKEEIRKRCRLWVNVVKQLGGED